jgi:hypothetical protein
MTPAPARRPPPDEVYRGVTRIFAVIIAAFGLVILAITISRGGSVGSVGIWLGLVFTGLGFGRLYLSLRGGER